MLAYSAVRAFFLVHRGLFAVFAHVPLGSFDPLQVRTLEDLESSENPLLVHR